MILTDLQKAFDTIHHDIMLRRLYVIGFSKHWINWFWSYLIILELFQLIWGIYFLNLCASSSVLQGSILGLLLFLIYINDMSQATKCNIFLYANDTCLVSQHKDIENEIELLKLNWWNWKATRWKFWKSVIGLSIIS